MYVEVHRLTDIIRSHNEHDPKPSELSGSVVLGSVTGMIADALEEAYPEQFDRGRFFEQSGYRLTEKGWIGA